MVTIPLMFLLAFALLGAFAGFCAGLFGVGGGGITMAMLVQIFAAMAIPAENAVHMALGTSMAAMVVTSFSSMSTHRSLGNVIARVVKAMAPTIIAGTLLASFVVSLLPARHVAVFFAAFMGFVAMRMLRTPEARTDEGRAEISHGRIAAAGFGIGFVSAIVSIGGGTLTVPFLHWQRVEMRKAIGTSAAIGFVIAASGSIGYALNGLAAGGAQHPQTVGFINVPAALLVGAMSYFTAPIGARMAHVWPVERLRLAFACLLVAVSAKMLAMVV